MRSIIVGTAGHIDHGKSALVQALTGTDPDRLKEEKARGITIDLGFAHLQIGELHLAFVDVPGHERFVKNMLAGVGGIDLVVLVVAADESVMPQTREHFDICRLLHVPAGIVAVTKSDLVDAETLELVGLEVRELVAGSFLDGAAILPVSSRTGAGLDDLRAALAAASARVGERVENGAARLPIDRVFSVRGFGTVVTGTLVSGRIATDDEVALVPGGRVMKVRGVEVHGVRQDAAVAGQRTAVNLGGIETSDVERGQALTSPGAFEASRVADAVLDVLSGAGPLKHGARVRFHQGTSEVMGRVALIGPLAPARGDQPRVVPSLAPGSRAFVRLRLERPAVLTRGDRYILRAYSPAHTIAGGHILDPRPPGGAVRTDAALARCAALDFDPAMRPSEAAEERTIRVMVAETGAAGLPVSALVSRIGLAPRLLAERIGGLAEAGDVRRIGENLVATSAIERLQRGLLGALAEHHARQPLSEGLAREEARERLFGRAAEPVFDAVVDELTRAGTIAGRDRLALPTHRLALSPDEAHARAEIERMFREAALKPPDQATVASTLGVAGAMVERMMKLLQRQKVLVKLETLMFHDEVLKHLKEEIAALKVSGAAVQIDVGTFKERFGVSRKYAIPLLEYLDRERITRRVGDSRVVL